MVFSILLQFLYEETIHRLIFLIPFGDDLKKLLLGSALYQSLFKGGLFEHGDDTTQKLQIIHSRILWSHDQEEELAGFLIDGIKIHPLKGPTKRDEKSF
jgi:hypothetical protein